MLVLIISYLQSIHTIVYIYIYIYIYISVANGLRTDTFGFRTRTDTCFLKKLGLILIHL